MRELAILLLAACGSQKTAPVPTATEDAATPPLAVDAAATTPKKPMTNDEILREKVGPDMIVTPWTGPAVAGFDLFFVRTKSSEGDPSSGAGAVVHAGDVLRGQDAMRAVIATGTKDAHALAAYSSYLLAHGADPLTSGDGVSAPPPEKALIKPPVLAGTSLEYWSYQPQIGAPVLLHTKLDLTTLAIASTKAEKYGGGGKDAVEAARAKFSMSAYDQKQGAAELGKLCSDPRVPKILATELAGHKVPDTRVAVAKAMAGCKDAASVKALVAALADKHAAVRKWAAESLGAIGDRSARPALEKLAQSEQDPDAKVSAQRAADKLK
ncbi:MAG TPA: HEAT repeat domain-containing protein [Kofleriaceae bacterium]